MVFAYARFAAVPAHVVASEDPMVVCGVAAAVVVGRAM